MLYEVYDVFIADYPVVAVELKIATPLAYPVSRDVERGKFHLKATENIVQGLWCFQLITMLSQWN